MIILNTVCFIVYLDSQLFNVKIKQVYTGFYVARNPPSIGRVTPFTIPDLLLSKNKMQFVTSSISANLPRGILANIGFALAGSDQPT